MWVFDAVQNQRQRFRIHSDPHGDSFNQVIRVCVLRGGNARHNTLVGSIAGAFVERHSRRLMHRHTLRARQFNQLAQARIFCS